MIFKRPATTQGLLLLLVAHAVQCTIGVPEAHAQVLDIPTDGLELWLSADGPMKVVDNRITEWTDRSGKGNNATHDSFGADIPTLAMANGKPTFAFSGGYTGFHFPRISTIRSVFVVLSKDSTSCLPTLPNYGTPAKFWIGGSESQTYFHPEHGCSIWNGNLSEVSPSLVNGKTYVNGKLVDGRKTYFPFTLGLVSMVSTGNVVADTIARDRTFNDRSWQGAISELLVYSKPLDDATRVGIQNTLASKYALDAGGAGNIGGQGGMASGGGGAPNNGGLGGSSGSTASSGGIAAGGMTSSGAGAQSMAGNSTAAGGMGGGGAPSSVNPAGAGGGPVGAAGTAQTPSNDANSGCSCAVKGQTPTDGVSGALLVALLVFAQRARSRKRSGAIP